MEDRSAPPKTVYAVLWQAQQGPWENGAGCLGDAKFGRGVVPGSESTPLGDLE